MSESPVKQVHRSPLPAADLDRLAQALVRCLAGAYRRATERAELSEKEKAPPASGARVEVRDDGARPSR
jgi:hypothetical protein